MHPFAYCRSKSKHQNTRQDSVQNGSVSAAERASVSRDSSSATEATPLLMNSNSPVVVPEVAVQKAVNKKSPSLLRTLFIVFGPLMAQGHLCKLFGDFMIFVGPMIQRLVLIII
jgi:hypothetical protein